MDGPPLSRGSRAITVPSQEVRKWSVLLELGEENTSSMGQLFVSGSRILAWLSFCVLDSIRGAPPRGEEELPTGILVYELLLFTLYLGFKNSSAVVSLMSALYVLHYS